MWKQPIPTNIEADFGEDSIAFTLYIMLLYKACNKDTVVNFGGNKLIELKRGQTIFGRNKWKNYFGISPSGIEKILKRLEKVTCKVTCERSKNCTVVTIKNYDELVSMSQAESQVSNMSVTSEWHVSNTSKSVKSDKSVKNDRKKIEDISEIISPEIENVNSLISKFQKINPSYKTFYANKTQRKCLERMVNEHGGEKMAKVIDALPAIVVKPYAPKITSPYELEKMFGKLILFISQEQKNGSFEQYQ